jgi:hypothetical protein
MIGAGSGAMLHRFEPFRAIRTMREATRAASSVVMRCGNLSETPRRRSTRTFAPDTRHAKPSIARRAYRRAYESSDRGA